MTHYANCICTNCHEDRYLATLADTYSDLRYQEFASALIRFPLPSLVPDIEYIYQEAQSRYRVPFHDGTEPELK